MVLLSKGSLISTSFSSMDELVYASSLGMQPDPPDVCFSFSCQELEFVGPLLVNANVGW